MQLGPAPLLRSGGLWLGRSRRRNGALALLGDERGLALDYTDNSFAERDMALAIGRATDYGTFSRGSGATYFGRDRILRTAGPNVLRLDHDPLTGEALGARLEGSSVRETNYPATFENNWNLWGNGEDGGNLLVRNACLAPDGTMSANQLVAGAENGLRIFRYPGIVYSARRTRMICLKEGTYRYARLSCFT